jgi:hypothetical protein
MKRSDFFLISSLVLNGALFGAIIFHNTRNNTAHANDLIQTKKSRVDTAAPAPSAAQALHNSKASSLWASIASDDFAVLAERLRAAGFPPSAIRAILQNRISDYYQNRRKQLLGPRADSPYWISHFSRPEPTDAKQKAELSAIEREAQKAYIKYLFPETAFDDEDQLARSRQHYGNLSPSTLTRLSSIEADYMEMQMDLWSSRKPGQDPSSDELQKLQLLEKERRADIVKALSPEELAEYELHASRAASMLRSQLRDFRPNESEYRALFALFSTLNNTDGSQPLAVRATFDQVKAQASSVLTPDRYADFLQTMNGGSDKLSFS